MKIIVLQGNQDDDFLQLALYSIEQYLNVVQSGDYRMVTRNTPRPYVEWVRESDRFKIHYYGLTSE